MPVLPEPTKAEKRRIEFNGIPRRYHLFVPSTYDGSAQVPLVFLLHGGGGLGSQMIPFTGFDKVAQTNKFILVCPDGVERHWNDGRIGLNYRAHADNIDDVSFIASLIDKLSAEFNIDRSRIYALGFSNGGMMTFRLGLELAEKITAIATVAANLPLELQSQKNKSELPILIMNATEDPIVSWDGGEIFLAGRSLGKVLSAKNTVDFWTKQNACDAKPRITTIKPDLEEPGINILRTDYINSQSNADVIFYTVKGAGHIWPGPHATAQYLPVNKIGLACRGFDASQAIWDFFQTYSKDKSICHKQKADIN